MERVVGVKISFYDESTDEWLEKTFDNIEQAEYWMESNEWDEREYLTEPVKPDEIVFINVYTITRHFGGHEEGGWWYNHYNCIETYPCQYKVAQTMQEYLDKKYQYLVHGNIYSVLGGREVDVRIELEPKESETRERPQYE